MAGSLTQQGEKLLLEYSIGRVPGEGETAPTSAGLYLALATPTTSPSETGTATSFAEVDYDGYERQALPPENWSNVDRSSSATSLTYNADVLFPIYLGDGLTVRYIALFTRETVGEGRPIWYSEVALGDTVGRTVQTGDTIKIPNGSIILTMT